MILINKMKQKKKKKTKSTIGLENFTGSYNEVEPHLWDNQISHT